MVEVVEALVTMTMMMTRVMMMMMMRMMMLVVVHSSCMLHIREMSQCILKNRSGSERKASRRIDRPLVRELVAAASRSELVVLTNQQSLG